VFRERELKGKKTRELKGKTDRENRGALSFIIQVRFFFVLGNLTSLGFLA
jgi:hypothetical protein